MVSVYKILLHIFVYVLPRNVSFTVILVNLTLMLLRLH